eukprot:2274863-Prymnesium_polylepis.1
MHQYLVVEKVHTQVLQGQVSQAPDPAKMFARVQYMLVGIMRARVCPGRRPRRAMRGGRAATRVCAVLVGCGVARGWSARTDAGIARGPNTGEWRCVRTGRSAVDAHNVRLPPIPPRMSLRS